MLLIPGLFAGPQALALGLGQAQVESYYEQPLVARIDLISRSEAEMATVTAGLASPTDFQVLGLTRAAIAAPLEFEIYRDLSDPHIRVTSQLPMNEPVVQLVVEVVWASGRMLRQYTLFLDPPTFDAPAPLPAQPTQRPVPPAGESVAREAVPDIEVLEAPGSSTTAFADSSPAAPAVALTEPTAPVAPSSPATVPDTGPPFDPITERQPEVASEPEPVASTEPVAERREPSEAPSETVPEVPSEPVAGMPAEPVAETPAQTPAETISEVPAENMVATSSEAVADPLPEAPSEVMPETVVEPEPEPVTVAEAPVISAPPSYRAVLPGPGQALPDTIDVQRGDTLWGLSRTYAEAQGVTINQVMLAVQQKNPNAFIQGNINAMMAGEILRMPDRDEVLARGVREAMLEVMRQESLYRTRWDLPPSPDALPSISNLADAGTTQEAAVSSAESRTPATADGDGEDTRLVLVPPSEGDAEAAQGTGQGGSGETGVSSGESVVEELARAREELANAQQENEYLADRLAELEAELSRRGAGEGDGVADTNLAEMEERLREERLSGEEDPELALPTREPSWLSRYGLALAALTVLIIAGLVWFLRSRRDPEFIPGLEEPLGREDDGEGVPAEPAESAGPESDDPETLLDLARAYMAMGKNPQARDCIEAVIRAGTPKQVREAREMLAEL